jgi:hypothetical protein
MSIKTPSPIDVLSESCKKGGLKEISKDHYIMRLQKLASITNISIDKLIMNPTKIIPIIKSQNNEAQTQRATINAILSVFKHDSNLKCKFPKAYTKWKEFFEVIDIQVQKRYDNNQPSQRQKDAYMSWENVIKKRDELDHESQAYLILMLYTAIPPLRADFGNVRIINNEPHNDEELHKGNFIVVKSKYIRLVLNDFKTQGSSKQYNKILPRDLENTIRASLVKQPRTHLIVSTRNGLPYTRDNTYIVYVGRLLEKVLGKNISISMLRHIYVNSLDYNTMTTGEKKDISSSMLHSVETNDRYRLKFNE